jgi:hypothetical protein
MLTHIVVWKYRADASQDIRNEHLALLRSLHSVVPGIESFSVGVDMLHSSKSYDTGLVATFRDHVKVVEFGRDITDRMAKVDFED